jgi:hypothetical protein
LKETCFAKVMATMALALALYLAPNASSASSLNADQIVDRVIKWAAAEHERNIKHTYRRSAISEDLDSDGKAEETNKLVYKAIIIGDRAYERLITKNGSPLSGEDLEKEQKKEKGFRAKQKEKKNDDRIPFDRKLANRYKFTLEGSEKLGGRPSYILRFKPRKDKELPDDKMADVVLNALFGKVWIDEQDFAVAKIQAALAHTVRIGLGVAATIKKAHLQLDIRKEENGTWLPTFMKSYIWGRTLLFKPIRNRNTSRFLDFKIASEH